MTGEFKISVLASGSKGNATVISAGGKNILIDAGISCRQLVQRLRDVGLQPEDLDAVLLTHEHRDHIAGLDDVRAFNFVDYPVIHRVDIYAAPRTAAYVRKAFDYAFIADKYRGAPEMELHERTDPPPS